jgi:uncharacterized protein YeaO (DUF488 family)
MIRTKSVYDPPEQSDGDRILVTRYWPRGISRDRLTITDWRQNLAPSKELLQDWKKHKITWQEYTLRYHEEMRDQQAAIKELADRAKRGTITLLCFERENDPHCHRHLLKELVEKAQ